MKFSQKKFSQKKINELCPIFYYDSLNPKICFKHNIKFCQGKIFEIEREDLSLFGLPAYGVHCNVWSKFKNSTFLHLARRSKNLKKFPGLLDNLVAGGQPTNISIRQNLLKEGYEEAGLKPKFLKFAKKSKTVHYMHNIKNSFNSAVIFIYQLEKLDEMKFSNQDGEVEDFIKIDIENLYKILEKNELKANCIIPIIDFFLLKEGAFLSEKVKVEIKKLLKVYD